MVPSTDQSGQFTRVQNAVIVHSPLSCANLQCKLSACASVGVGPRLAQHTLDEVKHKQDAHVPV